MSVSEALMDFLVLQGVGTAGADMFHSEAQAKTASANGVYWVTRRSQSPVSTNVGKLYREVFMDVFYINKQQQPVHDALEALEQIFYNCPSLPPYTCVEFEVVNHFVSEDRDIDERYYGALSVRATILI